MKQGVMQFAKVSFASFSSFEIFSHAHILPATQEHIDRLFETAKALFMNLHLTKGELLDYIHQTIDANGMQTSDDVHVRLVVSRGLKDTPHQNPRATIGVSTLDGSFCSEKTS